MDCFEDDRLVRGLFAAGLGALLLRNSSSLSVCRKAVRSTVVDKEFIHGKEKKKKLKQRIAMLMGQMLRGEKVQSGSDIA